MRIRHAAQGAKHRAFVMKKRSRSRAKNLGVTLFDESCGAINAIFPYKYEEARYAGTFLSQNVAASGPTRAVDNVIYCFWTGENPLTTNRQRNLNLMKAQNPKTEVVLVTSENLGRYIVADAPLHPAYPWLSLVHRSDFLRGYFMHHHGGGYSDIKKPMGPWLPALRRLDQEPNMWALGYRELSSSMCVQLPGRLGHDIKRYHRSIVGNGAFAFRPGTPLTAAWYQELLQRMDRFSDALARNPGNVRGSNAGYPIKWHGVLGEIMQPLCLKYHDRLILDESIRPSFQDYL